MMHRIRTALWAIWYALIRNSFTIRDGYIFIPPHLVQHRDIGMSNVMRIPLHARKADRA